MFASNNSNIDQNNKDQEHMAIGSEGNIYVSERTGDQIQVYNLSLIVTQLRTGVA
jgi:hypothetical protein